MIVMAFNQEVGKANEVMGGVAKSSVSYIMAFGLAITVVALAATAFIIIPRMF
jgi:uncharacterized membrane protein